MVYKSLLFFIVFVTSAFGNINIENLNSFKADFVQTVTNESGTKVEYKGSLFIKKDKKVVWRYKTPILKNVYVIDNSVIIDEPELEQAIYAKMEKNIDIVKLLNNAKKVKENLYETKIFDTEYFIVTINDEIKSIYYKDELSNKVDINFSKIQKNIELEDELFQFIPPEYYDIIKRY